MIQHIGPADRLDHIDTAHGRTLMERITTDEVMTRATRALAR